MTEHHLAEALFWIAAATVLYVYLGYPALLGAWAAIVSRRRRDSSRELTRGDALPPVSIVIAARNEARRLPGRIENLLAQDYPAERQIIVVSDGSSDDTLDVLAALGARVEAIAIPPSGKALALNVGVTRARHPILVFADARQRFAPDALRHLVKHFADPAVGAVSGQLVLEGELLHAGAARFGSAPDDLKERRSARDRRQVRRRSRDRRIASLGRTGSTMAGGTSAYWQYEKWLRKREGIVGSTLGVTGAIYAMRRHLWRPLPAETLLDDVLGPMRAVLGGARVIFEERALAFDAAAPDAAAEWRRKVRTLAGNYQVLRQEPRLLVPVVNPVWVQYMSHKVGRLLVPWALATAFVTSALLAPHARLYMAALLAQAGFYALAAYGAFLEAGARRARAAANAPSAPVSRSAPFAAPARKGRVHA